MNPQVPAPGPLQRAFARLLPSELADDPGPDGVRARLLAFGLMLLVAAALLVAPATTFGLGYTTSGAVLVVSGLGNLVTLRMLRRPGWIAVGADLLAANIVATVVGIALFNGDADAQPLAILACAPLFAGLLGSRHRALSWAVVSVVVILTLTLLGITGVVSRPPENPVVDIWASALTYSTLVVITLIIATVYGQLNEQSQERLAATEHVLRQAQEQAILTDRMASLGMLAAGVAHEINNPLTYVLGNVEYLSRDPSAVPSGELREAMREIRVGVHRIRDIVGNLKGMSRHHDVDWGPVEIEPLFRQSLRMVDHELRHRGQVEQLLEPVAPIQGNESLLGQVLMNLLVNAAHALPDDGRDNRIILRARMAAPRVVVLEVEDNGLGIAPDVAERIFDPFFTTKSARRGTGLGLAICRRIITDHQGEIEVESTPGVGTLFRITLPTAEPAPAPVDDEVDDDTAPLASALPATREAMAAMAAPPEPRDTADPTRMRILLVDDDALVARAIARGLAAGHDVSVEIEPLRALQRLRGGEVYDVVLCDVMMPGLSGPDLLRLVRAERPELADRFVFVSGGAFLDDVKRSLEELPNLRLEKPVDAALLDRALAEIRSRR